MIRSLARRWADTRLRDENELLRNNVATVRRIAKLLAAKLAAELDAMKEKT